LIKTFKNVPAVLLAIALAACLVGYILTRGSPNQAFPRQSNPVDQAPVDTSRLQTAIALASSAATPGEQAQAREAWRLADHELDLEYAAAMREAEAETTPATPRSRELAARIATLKQRVDADKKRVDQLNKDGGEQLDLAHAQLDLDQDELDDAQDDLAREGGDRRAKLERLIQEHEASDKVADQGLRFGSLGPTATLAEQLRAWFSLDEYDRELNAAGEQAASYAHKLLQRHNALQRQFGGDAQATSSLAGLRQLAAQQKALTAIDQRVQDSTQLAGVYQRWSGLVQARRRLALSLMLRSFSLILAILLGALLLSSAIRHGFRQTDRRRLVQLRAIARITFQIVAVLLILVIVFGLPTQLSTIIGLLTAGLTVALKDFIVAFFGWFMLLGRNGMSVGDWVEIEGVSGEVIEIGLLKTVLLELGNWTDKGHPTGRRVAFSNSFAMEGHYFNFSTSGQWLWDELEVALPQTGDPYEAVQQIRDMVDRETQADAAEAAKEWQRATHTAGARDFSASPVVHLRPGLNGLEVVVRYITRAPRRNAVRSKLFQAIVDLLRKPATTAAS
jgi:small-conductance mechanosensitive channel